MNQKTEKTVKNNNGGLRKQVCEGECVCKCVIDMV